MMSELIVDLISQKTILAEINTTRKQSSLELARRKFDYDALEQKTIHEFHECKKIKSKIIKYTPKYHKRYFVVLSVLAASSLFMYYYVDDFANSNQKTPLLSGYLIQNLKGDTLDTFYSWDIPKERILYVSIVNPNVIDSDKIQIIKDDILSEKTISLDNSLFNKGPSDSKSTYFLGWVGALKQASQTNTKFTIPSNFSIIEGSANGDITIVLSTLESPDGYFGFTRSTVENNQIFKSVITIYKANQLSSAELETIVRHEFGHAVGLIHSSDSTDLMHPTIETNYPFISQCDVSALIHLYDGNTNDKMACEI